MSPASARNSFASPQDVPAQAVQALLLGKIVNGRAQTRGRAVPNGHWTVTEKAQTFIRVQFLCV
jgi:hypothetical protein